MSRARIAWAFATARWGRRFRSRAALERHQRRRLDRHLRMLAHRSPWFREWFARHPEVRGGGAIELLPVQDKTTLVADFDTQNTVGATWDAAWALAVAQEGSRDLGGRLDTRGTGRNGMRGLAVGLSSGTSGRRGLFLTSPAERDRWAGTMLALTLPPRHIRGHRIALFLRADNALYETVRSRVIDFRFFDIHGDLDAHAVALEQYRPTILVAPPSVLDALADRGVEVRPERVYAVAEVLHDADARRLAAAFGQPFLHQLYQCTEGFLGRTCERGALHLNEEFVRVDREPVPGDAEGRRFVPLVTDFSRRSQPIVRYRLNDVLVARREPCGCGSPTLALERVEGREEDTLLLAGRPVFGDAVARAMVLAEGVTQYRITQTGPERLEVQLDEPGAEPSVRAALDALWTRLGIPSPGLVFAPYAQEPGPKRRRIRRSWQGGADEVL